MYEVLVVMVASLITLSILFFVTFFAFDKVRSEVIAMRKQLDKHEEMYESWRKYKNKQEDKKDEPHVYHTH